MPKLYYGVQLYAVQDPSARRLNPVFLYCISFNIYFNIIFPHTVRLFRVELVQKSIMTPSESSVWTTVLDRPTYKPIGEARRQVT